MEDISPSPTSRVGSLPGDAKNSDNQRPRKPLKPQPPPREVPTPRVDAEKDEQHQLDELA